MNLKPTFLVLLAIGTLTPLEAQARFRAGVRSAGAARVSASTSFRPGVGVTRSATVAAGRYHGATTLPAYRPGIAAPGAAVRTTRRVARRTSQRVAYRTAAGYSYYYGTPVYSLPSPACYAVMWNGMSAYNCGGVMYIYESSQYYPIEG